MGENPTASALKSPRLAGELARRFLRNERRASSPAKREDSKGNAHERSSLFDDVTTRAK
jgi:hypothetical protein